MKSPSWLIIRELNNRESLLPSYYERLQSVVETPETYIFEITSVEDTASKILETMKKNEWEQAFIRTDKKAAPDSLRRGSIVLEDSKNEITRTVRSLLSQIANSEWEHDGELILRERLNTNFCSSPSHFMCHPEIRYFIEGGEVLFWTPERPQVDCQASFSFYEDKLSTINLPHEKAEKVAKEFDKLSWAVDFILTENFNWVCVEMGLNGIRKHEEFGWVNICGHGSKESYGPRIVHGPALRWVEHNERQN